MSEIDRFERAVRVGGQHGLRGPANCVGSELFVCPRTDAQQFVSPDSSQGINRIDVIHQEAWLFCRTNSSVRLWWDFKEREGD